MRKYLRKQAIQRWRQKKRNDRTPSQATAPVTKNCKRKERILFCHLQMEPRLCQQSLGFRSAASGTERECAFCYFQLPFWDNLLLNMELLDVCKIITLLEKKLLCKINRVFTQWRQWEHCRWMMLGTHL